MTTINFKRETNGASAAYSSGKTISWTGAVRLEALPGRGIRIVDDCGALLISFSQHTIKIEEENVTQDAAAICSQLRDEVFPSAGGSASPTDVLNTSLTGFVEDDYNAEAPVSTADSILIAIRKIWGGILYLLTQLSLFPKVFNVKYYGALGNGVHDDTAAIQAALDACKAAGGGIVWFPLPSVDYLIGGNLITSSNGVNPNCQIEMPFCEFPSGSTPQMVSIKLLGEFPPAFFSEGVSAVGRNTKGVILRSSIVGSGTRPCVLGTAWASMPVIGDRNYLKVEIENIIVRTTTTSGETFVAGTMSAINFYNLTCFNTRNIKVDVTSPLIDGAEPTNETFGIIYPRVANKSELYNEGITFAEGYKYGVIPTEHATFNNLIVVGNVHGIYCGFGIEGIGQGYAVTILRLQAELNNNNITIDETTDLTIFQYEGEHYMEGDKWFGFEKDINFLQGEGFVNIFNSTIGVSNVGRTSNNSDFIANGKYKVFNGCGQNIIYSTSNTVLTSKVFNDETGWTFNQSGGSTAEIATDGGVSKAHLISLGGGVHYASVQKDISVAGVSTLKIILSGVNWISGAPKVYILDGGSILDSTLIPTSDGTHEFSYDASGYPSTISLFIGLGSLDAAGELYIRGISAESIA